ncbi:NB-ARC domain-containing protein [Kamptonema sp. UHCC 0994]|uniref:NB-ARC domain-containing protein n=1 Tax=Kamptonema sp. UHCC 0994 TaxID=3031329 RepID=UPI0023B981CE|nr:NB-ARC domain-containing protein [Kamptonema sp. UHCC 0994]MDF0553082.1 NB-ARC domain-containing protein [Kamptonema sp. UHCC 0994]
MNLKEVLKMADEMVFAKTGQHLDNLQEAILRGTMQGERYTKIADEIHCNESYVRDVGSKLWQILSEELGEDVSKSNFRATMERQQIPIVSHLEQHHNQISSVNFCGDTKHLSNILNSNPSTESTSNPQKNPTLHHDLSEMPRLGAFYDRTSELQTLKTSILTEKSQLITINGISGIGKTALATQLVQLIKNQFQYVIWRSLETSPTFPELQTNLIEFFSQPTDINSSATNPKPLPLIKDLQKHRCLIILDDIHNLFSSGQLAGHYQPGHEEYRGFFKQIKDLSHQSCLLLIGWESPREITQIKHKNTPIHSLTLTGLDTTAAREIFKEQGLEAQDNWDILINLYQGNPLWLKSVANLIVELGCYATDLLENDTILLPEDLKDILQQQCDRLSELEKQVLYLLAKESNPVNLAKLLEQGQISSSDLLNALQSLSRRCSIEKQDNLYTLPPVLKQYIKQLTINN